MCLTKRGSACQMCMKTSCKMFLEATRMGVTCSQTVARNVLHTDSRHGLINGLYSISHGKFIHDLLGRFIEVDFPGVISFGLWDFDHTVVLDVRHKMKEILIWRGGEIKMNGKRVTTRECFKRFPRLSVPLGFGAPN